MQKSNMILGVSAVSSMMLLSSCASLDNELIEDAPKPAVQECTVSFAEGQWRAEDWTMVKTSRSPYIGSWIQKADHVENAVPRDMSPRQMESSLETYASMLWKGELGGSFAVSSNMDFDYEMAPLVVFADTLGADANGYPEYRQHWEVILWNNGINVWHHRFVDGKQCWHLAASLKTTFQPNVKYDLSTEVRRLPVGAELKIKCGGSEFTYIEHDWPESVRAGITGCEGVNRFYDFRIRKIK